MPGRRDEVPSFTVGYGTQAANRSANSPLTFDLNERPAGMTITPDEGWKSMQQKFAFEIVNGRTGERYAVCKGHTVLICHGDTGVEQDANIGLEDYNKFWVAYVAEIRAKIEQDPGAVFLLVRWWSWPEELGEKPEKRREIIGRELFDVIRADTVANVISENDGLEWTRWYDRNGLLHKSDSWRPVGGVCSVTP